MKTLEEKLKNVIEAVKMRYAIGKISNREMKSLITGLRNEYGRMKEEEFFKQLQGGEGNET